MSRYVRHNEDRGAEWLPFFATICRFEAPELAYEKLHTLNVWDRALYAHFEARRAEARRGARGAYGRRPLFF